MKLIISWLTGVLPIVQIVATSAVALGTATTNPQITKFGNDLQEIHDRLALLIVEGKSIADSTDTVDKFSLNITDRNKVEVTIIK